MHRRHSPCFVKAVSSGTRATVCWWPRNFAASNARVSCRYNHCPGFNWDFHQQSVRLHEDDLVEGRDENCKRERERRRPRGCAASSGLNKDEFLLSLPALVAWESPASSLHSSFLFFLEALLLAFFTPLRVRVRNIICNTNMVPWPLTLPVSMCSNNWRGANGCFRFTGITAMASFFSLEKQSRREAMMT